VGSGKREGRNTEKRNFLPEKHRKKMHDSASRCRKTQNRRKTNARSDDYAKECLVTGAWRGRP